MNREYRDINKEYRDINDSITSLKNMIRIDNEINEAYNRYLMVVDKENAKPLDNFIKESQLTSMSTYDYIEYTTYSIIQNNTMVSSLIELKELNKSLFFKCCEVLKLPQLISLIDDKIKSILKYFRSVK